MANNKCFSLTTCRTAAETAGYHRHLFGFEKDFDECAAFEWIESNWKICYYFMGVYLVAIFVGRHLMRNRAPFQLRGALLAWNTALAVFSIFCAWRTVSAIFYQIGLEGFHKTVCAIDSKQYQHAHGIYVYYFGFSKFVELGDTAFIVLRKTPLIFLHWFHHVTVIFFVWSAGAYPSPIQNYFMAMNLFVHSFMYSYYVLKVLRIPVPKPVSMAITSLQLFQMLGGLFVALYTYYMRATPEVGCCLVDQANQIALAIYFAYFVLFANFFAWAYLLKKPSLTKGAKARD